MQFCWGYLAKHVNDCCVFLKFPFLWGVLCMSMFMTGMTISFNFLFGRKTTYEWFIWCMLECKWVIGYAPVMTFLLWGMMPIVWTFVIGVINEDQVLMPLLGGFGNIFGCSKLLKGSDFSTRDTPSMIYQCFCWKRNGALPQFGYTMSIFMRGVN